MKKITWKITACFWGLLLLMGLLALTGCDKTDGTAGTEDVEVDEPYEIIYHYNEGVLRNSDMSLSINPLYKEPFCLEIPAYDLNGGAIKNVAWIAPHLNDTFFARRHGFVISEVPHMIPKEEFEKLLARAESYYEGGKDSVDYKKFSSYWSLKSLDNCSSESLKQDLLSVFPIVEYYDIYVLDPTATSDELHYFARELQKFAPEYTAYEDEVKTQYRSADGWYPSGHYVEEVKIHEGIESIDCYAFSGCTGLKSISIPSTVYYIGSEAFLGCYQMESIVLPEGVSSIFSDIFKYCSSLTEITLPTTLTQIYCDYSPDGYYGGSNSEEYHIYDDFASYEGQEHHIYYGGTMEDWDRIELVLASSETLAEHPFHGWTIHCSDGEFVENSEDITHTCKPIFAPNGDGTQSNGKGTCRIVYWQVSDAEVVIPSVSPAGDLVTWIESYAFAGQEMSSLVLPDSIDYIEEYAFEGCQNLTDVYFSGTLARWHSIDIQWGNDLLYAATIHCTDGDIITQPAP